MKEGVKFDRGKRRLDLVPTEAINALADILRTTAKRLVAGKIIVTIRGADPQVVCEVVERR